MSRDADWKPLARDSRRALALLGHAIGPRCLPGERHADGCGATFAQHAAIQLAALKAVADHHLAHLGVPPGTAEQVYTIVADAIDCEMTCRWSS